MRYRFPGSDRGVTARVEVGRLRPIAERFYPTFRRSEREGRDVQIVLVREDGTYRLTGPSGDWYAELAGEALALYEAELTDALLGDVVDYVSIHGAAVEVGGGVLLLIGSSGSGKSTITAALYARGFRPLADDTLLVHPETARVHPFPRPIRVHESAADRAGLEPTALPGACVCPPYWWVEPPDREMGDGLPVRAMVLLDPGGSNEGLNGGWDRLSGSRMLEALLVARFGPGRPARDFEPLAALVDRAPGYRLVARLDEAIAPLVGLATSLADSAALPA